MEQKTVAGIHSDKVAEMIARLCEKAEVLVPEEGEFEAVFESFKVKDESSLFYSVKMEINHFELEEGREWERYAELSLYYRNVPYKGTNIMAFGNKHEVLEKLMGDDFVDRVMKKVEDFEHTDF